MKILHRSRRLICGTMALIGVTLAAQDRKDFNQKAFTDFHEILALPIRQRGMVSARVRAVGA